MLHLGRAVGGEHIQRRAGAEIAGYGLGKFYAAPHGHQIDVLRRPLQKNVAYIAADHIYFPAHRVCNAADAPEYGMFQVLRQIHSVFMFCWQ